MTTTLSVASRSPIPGTPPEWTPTPLAAIAAKIGSGATPRGGSAVYLAERERWALVRSQNVFDRHFDEEGLAFITDEAADELSGVALEEGDILLNITGDGITFARACAVPAHILPACVNQHVVRIRCNRNKCEPGFLLSYLTHPLVKPYIESFNAGGSRRAITKGNIESFIVPLPNLPTQRAIAGVLGALDDKIEVNRRMARTLEAAARALFESWFVRFEHPGGNGTVPCLVDSPMGPIPEGWRVGTLRNVAKERRDGVAADAMDGSMHYIALEHMPRRSIALADWSDAADVISNKLRFDRGDILFGKLRPYFHKVGVAPVSGICSTDMVVAQPVTPEWFGFVLGVMSSVDFVAHTDRGSAGTKMPRTNWTDMAAYRMALPPVALAEQFTTLVQPVVERIIAGIHECRTLAAVRDSLLPKLMSGEVAVPEALGRAD